jgi:tRNA threonylcarbamoyladenosine biosynthesis protein TsaB
MLVLALDTTTRGGSAALVDDDRVILQREGSVARSHAERLPGDLLNLIQEAASSLSAVDLFAVAAGPGSFTGLRIGIATMQGLAFARSRPIVAVSTLEALGQAAAGDLPPGTIVGAWIDGYRHDVFTALYRVTQAGACTPERLEELEAAAVGDPATTLLRWRDHAPAVLIGDGAMVYRRIGEPAARVIAPPPLAATIGRMAAARAARGLAIDPAGVLPVYVRRPDAEVERERKEAASRDQ